jgi:hypothetical protein
LNLKIKENENNIIKSNEENYETDEEYMIKRR